MAAPGHLFNLESKHFLDFVFPHHFAITKIHMKIMGQKALLALSANWNSSAT
jgi:hypothetical protein